MLPRRRILSCWLASAVLVGMAAVTPTAGAAACSLAPTNGTVRRLVGARTYTLRVPAGLAGPQAPLLLSMHGLTGTSQSQESMTGWSAFAAANGVMVAYPQGVLNSWNFNSDSYDVAFLRSVVADIAATWCVDPQRVYADGHSNGAFMSQRLACDAADVFAAVVEYAGGSPSAFGTGCAPVRPVGVGLFHGENDQVVSPSSGRAARDQWVARNGCAPVPVSEPTGDGTLLRYTGCGGGIEVWWRSYPGQGHGWPTGARGADQRSRMWAFLLAHPRP